MADLVFVDLIDGVNAFARVADLIRLSSGPDACSKNVVLHYQSYKATGTPATCPESTSPPNEPGLDLFTTALK